jgi:hypothetical protein
MFMKDQIRKIVAEEVKNVRNSLREAEENNSPVTADEMVNGLKTIARRERLTPSQVKAWIITAAHGDKKIQADLEKGLAAELQGQHLKKATTKVAPKPIQPKKDPYNPLKVRGSTEDDIIMPRDGKWKYKIISRAAEGLPDLKQKDQIPTMLQGYIDFGQWILRQYGKFIPQEVKDKVAGGKPMALINWMNANTDALPNTPSNIRAIWKGMTKLQKSFGMITDKDLDKANQEVNPGTETPTPGSIPSLDQVAGVAGPAKEKQKYTTGDQKWKEIMAQEPSIKTVEAGRKILAKAEEKIGSWSAKDKKGDIDMNQDKIDDHDERMEEVTLIDAADQYTRLMKVSHNLQNFYDRLQRAQAIAHEEIPEYIQAEGPAVQRLMDMAKKGETASVEEILINDLQNAMRGHELDADGDPVTDEYGDIVEVEDNVFKSFQSVFSKLHYRVKGKGRPKANASPDDEVTVIEPDEGI